MVTRKSPTEIFSELRKLAAEDPRQARREFSGLLDANAPSVEEVLRLAGEPGEGRLRQLIANAVKLRTDKARVIPHLRDWLARETDEFASAAIGAALRGVDQTAFQASTPPNQKEFVELYRYVAGRLCHRIRNSMTGPTQHLRTLESIFSSGMDPISLEAKDAVGRLKDSLRALSRIVEFNIDDTYFEWRPVDIAAWLRDMTNRYNAANVPLSLKIVGQADAQKIRVRANDLMLEIIFWNLWKNAQQAIGHSCEITVNFTLNKNEVKLLISDNGRGFNPQHVSVAFVEQFSTMGPDRGRGLLEVHDAISRVGGNANLIRDVANEYRICIILPVLK
jgi:signal transduction histidine kinase